MICCSVAADDKEKALEEMMIASRKADAVEIRLDYISDLDFSDIDEIISKKPCPLILTCRKEAEGGGFKDTESKRISIIRECLKKGADYADIEYSSGEDVISGLSDLAENRNRKLIVSYHNFNELPADISDICNKMRKTRADIVKIACKANSLNDNLRILSLLECSRREKFNIIGHCMGDKGGMSRILGIAYGSLLSYGYLNKRTAHGQIKAEHLKRLYRADKLKKEGLKIFGLVGNPVSESRGYIVHNLMLKKHEQNAVYINFPADDLGSFIRNFRGMLNGFSVTMPYKEAIMQYLDEADAAAEKIGAVNTVVISGGRLKGYNTDAYGALRAIEEAIDIKNKNVVIIGAGGAAKAIGYGLMEKGARLTINNRSEDKGIRLAKELRAEFRKKEEIKWREADLLINATSIGMAPKINESPVESKYLRDMVVFDAIYNPLITKMLDNAERNGCRIISGIKMFAHQAAKQYELFTGLKPDLNFMEKRALEYVAQ
ncbi:shikimate dehydrogenase [Candidatus Woesearchaeota archaeon]|nr:shikimate dehydrogenase [Candidatus Woesearchaeota archaeon]